MTELRPELWLPGTAQLATGRDGAGPEPRELEQAWACYPQAVRVPSRIGEFELEPLPPGPMPVLDEPWRIELSSAAGPFTILAERRLLQAFMAELPERPVLDGMEEAESTLLSEFATIDLIEAAERLLGVSLLVRRCSRAATLVQPQWRLWARAVFDDGRTEPVQIGLPGPAASQLLQILHAPLASDPRLSILPSEHGTARLFIGILDLPQDAVAELTDDDIIFIEGCRDNVISGIFICEDGTSWPVNVHGASAEVISPPGETARLAFIGQMPDLDGLEPRPQVGMQRIAFEFGSMEYSPRSLRMLKTGASININRLPEGLVSVMCNGRALARGRVVHVEGGIGVKIEN
jgi:hypothetical protein